MLQDYIITSDQTLAVLPIYWDSNITYSEPIPQHCHGTHYSVSLCGYRHVRGCVVGKRGKVYANPEHSCWHGVSINTYRVHRVWLHWGMFKGKTVAQSAPLFRATLQFMWAAKYGENMWGSKQRQVGRKNPATCFIKSRRKPTTDKRWILSFL